MVSEGDRWAWSASPCGGVRVSAGSTSVRSSSRAIALPTLRLAIRPLGFFRGDGDFVGIERRAIEPPRGCGRPIRRWTTELVNFLGAIRDFTPTKLSVLSGSTCRQVAGATSRASNVGWLAMFGGAIARFRRDRRAVSAGQRPRERRFVDSILALVRRSTRLFPSFSTDRHRFSAKRRVAATLKAVERRLRSRFLAGRSRCSRGSTGSHVAATTSRAVERRLNSQCSPVDRVFHRIDIGSARFAARSRCSKATNGD